MNDPQRSTLDAPRLPQSDTLAPDVFVLTECTVDGASISAGTLCLVMPNGDTVRIPLDREKVGPVARALMTHPAVLLLAREGVALPKALPVPGNPLPIDTALPGTVAYANRLRLLARSLHPSNLRVDLLALADDLARAPDAIAAPAVPFDPAVHVTRAEVVADLHRLSIHTDSERVECHESGNRDGAAALQRVDTCIAKVCAKYEVRA